MMSSEHHCLLMTFMICQDVFPFLQSTVCTH